MPADNLFFNKDACPNGMRNLRDIWAEKDRKEEIDKETFLKTYRRKKAAKQIRQAKRLHRKLRKIDKKKSLESSIKRLRKITKKDERAKGTKQQKLMRMTPKERREWRKQIEEKQARQKVKDVLNELDLNSSRPIQEKEERYEVGHVSGYISPKHASSSPYSNFEEESDPELDEQRNGLGEGTSMQYSDGEPIEEEMENEDVEEPLLEMMLHGDAAQLQSPITTEVMKATIIEEGVERIPVPGGTATIVEIVADDPETENLQKFNKKVNKSKISKFLASSSDDPFLSVRSKKYSTPVTELFKITDGPEKVKIGMAYKTMVDRKFNCPPHRDFATLVRSRIHERRMAALAASAASTSGAVPSLFHQSSPMIPLFQSPAMPPHTPSPSVGPLSHHPMGPPGYPATPGAFPPTTPTYPGMPSRPGSNFGPGPGYPPHQMMAPGYPAQMGQRPQFINAQIQQQMQMQMRMQMMQQRQMSQQGMQPGFVAGMPHYPQPPATPGLVNYGMPGGPSSVQQLNNFVNQSRFGPTSGHPGQPSPYGIPPIIPQSPNFNQTYQGMNNSMMSPLQQHQFHQQQMHQQMQQQQQQQLHHQQMQRNQMMLQHQQHQQQQALAQQTQQPTALQLHAQAQQSWNSACLNMSPKQKVKFAARQRQLSGGLMPMNLQPTALRNLRNPPDPNVPMNKLLTRAHRPPEVNVPEGDSLSIAIILSDTILDLHFDSVFDACPICSCSVSIRSRDLGMYITPHEVLRLHNPGHSNMREHTIGAWSGFHVNSATACTCGFSAIRHRYLSCCTGLFAEDANEATTLDTAVAAVIPPLDYPKRSTSRNMSWFNSSSVHDMALLNQIRQLAYSHSYGKAISQMATMKEHNRDLGAGELSQDISAPSEYIVSHVDTMELLMLGNSALDMSMKNRHTRTPNFNAQFMTYFHPWGLQTANEITELEGSEWIDLLGFVTNTIEGAMKQARKAPEDVPFSVEGPLTWKQFVAKSIRGRPVTDEDEEDFSSPETVPAVMRATEKEAIRVAPHIEQFYDQAGLGPVDQPKDIMYLTIIPDDLETYEKTVKFMEDLTEMYEKMRLGKHIPFPVSTQTATLYRKLHRELKEHYPDPEHLKAAINARLAETRPYLAKQFHTVSSSAQNWGKRLREREEEDAIYANGLPADYDPDYEGDHEEFRSVPKMRPRRTHDRLPKKNPGFYEREGILRIGTIYEPSRGNWKMNVTKTDEFINMTKHLDDETGFVTRLKLYLQQMEDLVAYILCESREAYDRKGYRYQLAVENRLKKEKYDRDMKEEELRFNAAKDRDNELSADGKKPDDSELPPGHTEFGNDASEEWKNEDLEAKKLKKQQEEEQYPPEGYQAPSPVPAGMVHIPETLSKQEQTVQPTLNELMADPSSVMPHNAASISWTQRANAVPNPFPYSNQPPVPFESIGSEETDPFGTLPHVIVLYIVNPFCYGEEGRSALHMRIAILAFIRAYNSLMSILPYDRRPQLQMELIGLESLDDVSKPFPDYFNDPKVPFDLLYSRKVRPDRQSNSTRDDITRALSVAVYTHPRVFLPGILKAGSARCMTAFGPGSQLFNTINELERINRESHKSMLIRSRNALASHPIVLPSQHAERKSYIAYKLEEEEKAVVTSQDEQTLFIAYCLVGTEFLVATATDAQGKLIDNCIANMKPDRENNQLYRYKNKTQILDGMGNCGHSFWESCRRKRRTGDSAWTHLLSKASLLRYSSSLKDICGACKSMPSIIGTPAILSACLISLEPEPSIRIMPDFYDQDPSAKKTIFFQTPGDVSCTHILTFPVGAEINLEVQDQTADPKADENWEFGDLDMMEGLDDGDTEIIKDLGLGLETPSSAAIRQTGGTSMFFSEDSSTIEIQNQPLASGYYISTAPAPELPNWFWATSPSSKRHSPVHLKSSLHINISEVKNDDIAMESTKEKDKDKEKEEKFVHPLESRQTEEVLRHVLESYNALSWLNMNRQTGERYSCLPIHVQHLLRLYHSVARLIV
ncbi:unnamed protein product [Caenorhabditis sp. 36 PRJEB53466]|nr:unnamed protein product [Caenorhabditis sp. 36 PRJEB53466]